MSFFLIFLTLLFWFLFYFYYQFLILFHIQIFFLFIFLIFVFVFSVRIDVLSILFWKYLFLCCFWNFCLFLAYCYCDDFTYNITQVLYKIVYLIINISYEFIDSVKACFFCASINKFQYKNYFFFFKRLIRRWTNIYLIFIY